LNCSRLLRNTESLLHQQMDKPKHTPGPWRWELNLKHKSLTLCGGRPVFDKTVMDFERWGMTSATPRFNDPEHGLLNRAMEYAEIIKGRDHHAHWCQSLNHPDALLIQAAPEMFEALKSIVEYWNNPQKGSLNDHVAHSLQLAELALNKATNG